MRAICLLLACWGSGLTIPSDSTVTSLNRVRCDLQFASGGGRFNSIDVGPTGNLRHHDAGQQPGLIITALTTNVTVSGVIQGNGGLIKRGEGALFLRGSGANTYTGATRLEGGATHLAKTSAARAISPIAIIDVASLSDDLPGQYPPMLSMTMTNSGNWFITNGATVTNLTMESDNNIRGSGLLTLQCDVNVFRGQSAFFVGYTDISCPIYLGDRTRTFTVKDGADGIVDFYLYGQIIGPGPGLGSAGIVKKGSGQMVLSAANIFFGPTLIQGGELTITHGGALGDSGTGAETIVDLSTLTFSAGFNPMSVPEPLIMTGGDIEFSGSTVLTGPVVVSNFCTLEGRFDTSLLEITGVISGPERFQLSCGVLRLSGSAPNTFGSASPFPLHVGSAFSSFGISRATLELAKPDDVLAVPNPVSVSAGDTNQAILRNLQNGGVIDVTIAHCGSWQLNGHSAAPTALTFKGDGYVDTQGGLLQLTNPTTNQVRVISSFPANYIAGISGRLSCAATTNIFVVESNLTLNVAARISGGADFVKERPGHHAPERQQQFHRPDHSERRQTDRRPRVRARDYRDGDIRERQRLACAGWRLWGH